MSEIKANEYSLSPAGEQRRDVMLAELQRAMRRMHWRRRVVRRGGVVVVLAGVVFGVSQMISSRTSAPATNTMARRESPVTPAPMATERGEATVHARVVVVHTENDVLNRYRADIPATIERIDDDDLLQMLWGMDRPAGLIRMGGETRLSAAVTDAELGRANSETDDNPSL